MCASWCSIGLLICYRLLYSNTLSYVQQPRIVSEFVRYRNMCAFLWFDGVPMKHRQQWWMKVECRDIVREMLILDLFSP